MVKHIKVTNYLGESITIELRRPEKSGFAIRKISGLGPGDANINLTDMSGSDGSVYNSARMNTRNIVLDIAFLHEPTIEEVRLKSYKYFPIKKKILLEIQTDNRLVEIYGYVETNDPDIFSNAESTQISIICPDPYFYSTGKDGTQVTTFSGIEPLLEFPFANESLIEPLLEYGGIMMRQEQNVYYIGDAETGITINMHALGDVTNITIYNSKTRETMRIDTDKMEILTGSGMSNGDDIIITTNKGNKKITLLRNGIYTNILNCLDKNSDWFTLTKGDNVFAFTADTGTEYLQFRIENRVVYEGV